MRTDERKPVLVGLALWLLAFVALWIFAPSALFGQSGWVMTTFIAALVIGVAGFVWASLRHH